MPGKVHSRKELTHQVLQSTRVARSLPHAPSRGGPTWISCFFRRRTHPHVLPWGPSSRPASLSAAGRPHHVCSRPRLLQAGVRTPWTRGDVSGTFVTRMLPKTKNPLPTAECRISPISHRLPQTLAWSLTARLSHGERGVRGTSPCGRSA